jgi:hypothetical protein
LIRISVRDTRRRGDQLSEAGAGRPPEGSRRVLRGLAEPGGRVTALSPAAGRAELALLAGCGALARSPAPAVRAERSGGFRGRVKRLGVRSGAGRLEGARSARVLAAARRADGSAPRTGVSQYGQSVQRGSIGLPHATHGSLTRTRQFGQRR